MPDVTVIYQDGMLAIVAPSALQSLIDRDEIVKFQRSDHWVYPGVDPIRGLPSSVYQGPERRAFRL